MLSLVTIIAIYREGGILKRLRATPLRPHTILTAHVLVKLLFTRVTLALMVLAGRRYYPVGRRRAARVVRGGAALQHAEHPVARVSDRQHRSDGAIRAADRHAHPLSDARAVRAVRARRLAAAALQAIARALPPTYAVSLLRGIWRGEGWSAHIGDVAALAVIFIVCLAISAKTFRWE